MGSDAVFVQGTFPSFIDVRPSASRARLEILFSLSIHSELFVRRPRHQPVACNLLTADFPFIPLEDKVLFKGISSPHHWLRIKILVGIRRSPKSPTPWQPNKQSAPCPAHSELRKTPLSCILLASPFEAEGASFKTSTAVQ